MGKRDKEEEKIDYQAKLEKCLLETRAICHELSQPITVISGYSELLLLNKTKDDPQYEKLFEIKKQADVIDKIVRRLRYFVKYTMSDNSPGNEIIGGDV
ncbi:MAG: histidine kinase dimerization/phospho-acceptor domain-containing protein [Desulfobacterales bacterium]|nr:histidine kinase dimerization/phospho-acceptor domain-containing protein [Desulfobacterales bacterium]